MTSAREERSERLTRLVEEALDRFDREGRAGVDAYYAEHPDDASAVRRKIDALLDAGFLAAAGGAPPPAPRELGEYRVLETLGEGGMGVVYLAEHRALGRRVALKVIRPEHLLFSKARERFRREVEAVARLRHPGVVPVHAVGEHEGIPYFAMELVDGCSLADVVRALLHRAPASLSGVDAARTVSDRARRSGAAGADSALQRACDGSWSDACCRLLRQAAEALDHVHRNGVVHRDVKPNNLMVTASGRVMLVDFGLAQSEGASPLTQSGAELGSLPYLAPEQIDARRGAAGPRTDVYGLGVVLYELLTLQLPFAHDTAQGIRQRIIDGRPARVRALNPGVPWELETVCAKAMDPDPQRRYASASDFARDLDHVLARRPIEARRPAAMLAVRRWAQRRPALATAVALTAVAAVGLPIAWGVQEHHSITALEAVLRRTEGLRLAAVSTNIIESDPPLALRLALEAHGRAPGFIARNAVYAALAAHDQKYVWDSGGAAVHFTRDGSACLAADADGALRAYDVATGELRFEAQAHDARAAALEVSSDGASAWTASPDGTLARWSLNGGARLARVQDEPRALAGAALSPDGARIVSWTRSGAARVRSAETGGLLMELRGHEKAIGAVEWSRDGRGLLSRSDDGTVRAWSAADGACTATLRHGESVADASFSPDGRKVATAERLGPARIFNMDGVSEPVTLREDGRPVTMVGRLAWSPDGARLLTVSRDHHARIFSASGELLLCLRGHDRLLRDCAWSPDGRRVATAGDDRSIRIWNASTGEPLQVLSGHRAPITSVEFSPDGEMLVSAADDVRLWRTPASRALSPERLHAGKMTRCYFSDDGGTLASAAFDGVARLFRWSSASAETAFGPYNSAVMAAAVNEASRRAAVGLMDGAVHVVGFDGAEIASVAAGAVKISSLAFSSDGARLLVCPYGREARIYSAETGAETAVLPGARDSITAGALSGDGRFAAIGDRTGSVRVFDAAGGALLATLRGHKKKVSCARFDAAGARLVTGAHDGKTILWDWAAGRALHELAADVDFVWCGAVSSDGRWIATGSSDRAVRLWSAESGELEAELRGHDDIVSDVAFIRGGKELASAAGRGGVLTWPVDALRAAAALRKRVLTADECARTGFGSPTARRAADAWLERLRTECIFSDDVRERIESERGVDDDVRDAAREAARDLRDRPRRWLADAWRVLSRPGFDRTRYDDARRRAEAALRAAPDARDVLRAAGVARYRTGDAAGAVAILERPELAAGCDGAEEPPVTHAFLALASARAGDRGRARDAAATMRNEIASLRAPSEYLQALAAEAESAAGVEK